jgi:serine/threonine protein kinase
MSSNHNSRTIDYGGLLDEVIAAYLKAIDAGRAPSQSDLCDRFPAIADELASFFADHNCIAQPPAPSQHGVASTVANNPQTGGCIDLGSPAPRRQALQPGSVLAGKYRINAMKAGGMGQVYIAEDLTLPKNARGRRVALKTVADYDHWCATREARRKPSHKSLYTDNLKRFHREAMNWVRLGRHPNIVFAWWVIEVGSKPYLVLEYADSGDVGDWIKERRLTIPLTVNFAIQFCRGMTYAIAKGGLVHRDIKPSNLLVHENSILKITDLGLAKADALDDFDRDGTNGPLSKTAKSADGVGTPPYMAPEQFGRVAIADTRSDIFSFGATLFEMLTSQRLFVNRTSHEMASLHAMLPMAHEVQPTVPRSVSKIVNRCLEFEPNQRYESFAEIESDLSKASTDFSQAIGLPVDHDEILTESLSAGRMVLGETYSLMSLGDFEAAAACAQHGIDIEPTNWEHWANKAKALVEVKDYVNAYACSSRAVDLNPTAAVACANHAWTTLLLGDATAAVRYCQHAIEADTAFIDGWVCLGTCQRSMGRLKEAAATLTHARDLGPHEWKAHANLGFCLIELGRTDDAMRSLQIAAQINPTDPLVWLQIAWIFASRRDFDAATAALDTSLTLKDNDAEAWALRGLIVWEGYHDEAAARASLARAIALDPRNWKAQHVLAMIDLPAVNGI